MLLAAHLKRTHGVTCTPSTHTESSSEIHAAVEFIAHGRAHRIDRRRDGEGA